MSVDFTLDKLKK